jgi:hypothetical protein
MTFAERIKVGARVEEELAKHFRKHRWSTCLSDKGHKRPVHELWPVATMSPAKIEGEAVELAWGVRIALQDVAVFDQMADALGVLLEGSRGDKPAMV